MWICTYRIGGLRDEGGWKRLKDCPRWMKLDFRKIKCGDTSPTVSGSFESLAGLTVGNDVP